MLFLYLSFFMWPGDAHTRGGSYFGGLPSAQIGSESWAVVDSLETVFFSAELVNKRQPERICMKSRSSLSPKEIGFELQPSHLIAHIDDLVIEALLLKSPGSY